MICEQDELWSASRYFAYDKMQELYDERRKKVPKAPGRPAAGLVEAVRKIILREPRACREGGCGVAWPLGFRVREKAEAPRRSDSSFARAAFGSA